MVGAEILVEGAVAEHVVDGRQERGGDGSDGLLGCATVTQALELSLQVRGVGALNRLPAYLIREALRPGSVHQGQNVAGLNAGVPYVSHCQQPAQFCHGRPRLTSLGRSSPRGRIPPAVLRQCSDLPRSTFGRPSARAGTTMYPAAPVGHRRAHASQARPLAARPASWRSIGGFQSVPPGAVGFMR